MHGERKVRGGKLVVVDATVSADTIIDVVLSGDFFLEPDEALGWLTEALEGQSVDVSLDQLTAVLDTAARDAELVGFGTRDVALTVPRALGRATTWDDLELEIVETGPLSPRMQMALDEVIVRQVAEGRRAPNLRFWDWASSAVVIGSYQSSPTRSTRPPPSVTASRSYAASPAAAPCSSSRATRSPTASPCPTRSWPACPSRSRTPSSTSGCCGGLRSVGIEAAYAG